MMPADPPLRKERNQSLGLWLAVAAVLVIVASLAFRLFAPISTPPFYGADGHPQPSSIAVAERWYINGVDQSVIIRGRDRANPVLIWLHGGPGSSETPILRAFNSSLEDHFTVVYWDQRLAGQTLDPLAPLPTNLTVANILSDLDVLVDRVRARLGQDKVLLVGHSWGTMLGVIYTSRHPDKVAAYVGIGQMTDKPTAEAASYDYTLNQAKAWGDVKAQEELKKIGRPPYSGGEIFTQRALLDKFGGNMHAALSLPRSIVIGIQQPESNWRDLWAMNHGGQLGLKLLEPELLATNLDRTYTHFETPIFIAAGRYDRVTDAAMAHTYFNSLTAPQKSFLWFERSGHSPNFEEAAKFNTWVIEAVRPVVISRNKGKAPPHPHLAAFAQLT